MGIDYNQKITAFEYFIVPLMPHGCHLSGSLNLLQLLSHFNNAYNHSNPSTYSPSEYLPTIVYHLQHTTSTPSHCILLAIIPFHLQLTARQFQVPSFSTIPYQLSLHVAANRLIFQSLPLGVYLFTFCFKRNAKILWQEVATPLYTLKLNYFLHLLIGCMYTTQVL